MENLPQRLNSTFFEAFFLHFPGHFRAALYEKILKMSILVLRQTVRLPKIVYFFPDFSPILIGNKRQTYFSTSNYTLYRGPKKLSVALHTTSVGPNPNRTHASSELRNVELTEIAFLAVLNFFPSSKMDFRLFLKLQKNGIWSK